MSKKGVRERVHNIARVSILLIGALSASCGSEVNFTGSYTMLGQRTTSAACMSVAPSGSIGTADVQIAAPDANGTFTMQMRVGTSSTCVLTLTRQGETAAISNASNCDATIAPPFFTTGTGNLSEPNGQLRLSVRWSMSGPGAGPCAVDDVWATPTR